MRKGSVSTKRELKQNVQGKWREKTIHEHAHDGISFILKKLNEEDGVQYHLCRERETIEGKPETAKYMNQFTVNGDEKAMSVTGNAVVSWFDMEGNHHDRKTKVTYKFTGYIGRDNLHQNTLIVEEYEVDGI